MLIELTIDQAMNDWGVIRAAIMETLPKKWQSSEIMALSLLKSVQDGTLTVWVISTDNKLAGVLTTTIIVDKISMQRNLLIYSLKSRQDKSFTKGEWVLALATLREYAKKNGCFSIVAYTTNNWLSSKVKMFGWNVEQFISMEV